MRFIVSNAPGTKITVQKKRLTITDMGDYLLKLINIIISLV